MKKTCLLLLALGLCLTGCVPVDSLNPIYNDKDVVFDESLLGFWVAKDEGKKGGLEFSRMSNNEKIYVVTMFDQEKGTEGSRTTYHARLVKLAGHEFLDVVPTQWDAHPESYALQIKSGSAGTSVEPRFIRLGEASYFEFVSGSPGDSGKVKANLRRAHWILRVNRRAKNLQFDWADDDDFRKAVQNGSMHLPATVLGEGKNQNVVITASTAELQKFVLEHAGDNNFFNKKMDELHLKR